MSENNNPTGSLGMARVNGITPINNLPEDKEHKDSHTVIMDILDKLSPEDKEIFDNLPQNVIEDIISEIDGDPLFGEAYIKGVIENIKNKQKSSKPYKFKSNDKINYRNFIFKPQSTNNTVQNSEEEDAPTVKQNPIVRRERRNRTRKYLNSVSPDSNIEQIRDLPDVSATRINSNDLSVPIIEGSVEEDKDKMLLQIFKVLTDSKKIQDKILTKITSIESVIKLTSREHDINLAQNEYTVARNRAMGQGGTGSQITVAGGGSTSSYTTINNGGGNNGDFRDLGNRHEESMLDKTLNYIGVSSPKTVRMLKAAATALGVVGIGLKGAMENQNGNNIDKNTSQDEKAKYGMKKLVSLGMDKEDAAALLGNASRESSFDIKAVGDGGKSIGLLQWDATRRANFEKVFKKPFNESTYDEQLEFAYWETNNTHKKQFSKVHAAKTIKEKSELFERGIEVTKESHDYGVYDPKRTTNAERYTNFDINSANTGITSDSTLGIIARLGTKSNYSGQNIDRIFGDNGGFGLYHIPDDKVKDKIDPPEKIEPEPEKPHLLGRIGKLLGNEWFDHRQANKDNQLADKVGYVGKKYISNPMKSLTDHFASIEHKPLRKKLNLTDDGKSDWLGNLKIVDSITARSSLALSDGIDYVDDRFNKIEHKPLKEKWNLTEHSPNNDRYDTLVSLLKSLPDGTSERLHKTKPEQDHKNIDDPAFQELNSNIVSGFNQLQKTLGYLVSKAMTNNQPTTQPTSAPQQAAAPVTAKNHEPSTFESFINGLF